MICSKTRVAPEQVAAHYDELDHFYRGTWGEHLHHGIWEGGDETPLEAVENLVRKVAATARLRAGSPVCDIGCGYGATARLLADEFGARVTGVTLSAVQHRFATTCRHKSDNPRYLLADWLRAAFPANSFDTCLAIESSEHMADKGHFFARAHHALRPGGRLVICAWLARETVSSAGARWLLEPICREGRIPHLGSAGSYREMAAEAGFVELSFEDLTRRVVRTWPAVIRRFCHNLSCDPRYSRFLLRGGGGNRIFALTIFRIWLAYLFGVMRYGLFAFEKTDPSKSISGPTGTMRVGLISSCVI